MLRGWFEQATNFQFIQQSRSVGKISPLTAIEKLSGARNGKIRADFYDDCQDIPDPSALEHMQKNLLLLDDCFPGKQNKAEAYYTRRRHNNCDMITSYRNTIRENSNYIILFPQGTENLTYIHADHCANDISLLEFKQFCHEVCSEKHNFVTIDLTSTPMNGKYRQNFKRFYFPTGNIHILSVIMEAYRSVIMEAFQCNQNYYIPVQCNRITTYKEVLFEEATEEWYAQRDPDEVDRGERHCIRLAQQFGHLVEEYRERFSPPRIVAAHLEIYLLPLTQLDNLYDDKEIDQLESDRISWQRDYTQNNTWGDSRTSILEAMQCKL